ncbi:hypothetical protein [Amycolatopsis sp. cmx-11-12]|uniref:hypothetical protein n=1 Tax=Amycolatopsis sp. cmx-11-12 TaxID=2785795 RepID=UPI003918286E
MDSDVRPADAATVDHARQSAAPAEHGIDLGHDVWLAPASRHNDARVSYCTHRIYRNGVEIGRVDYQICHTCKVVLLGEIRLDRDRRRGIGTRVVGRLCRHLAGHRWAITPGKPGARPFWDRIRAAYPAEYLPCAHDQVGCSHLLF